jgi:hypothetical protein
MRKLLLVSVYMLPFGLAAQTPLAAAPPAQIQTALTQALTGDWTGILEYRDYSEPETSTKRVQLPTWLHIAPSDGKLTWYFVYDDGPNKTVDETLHIALDVAAGTYAITNDHNRTEIYKVSGYTALSGGRGTLLILGPGTDNDKPVETRITLTVRRNLLQMIEENRPPTGTAPFVFRHSYTFTRATAPKVTPTR